MGRKVTNKLALNKNFNNQMFSFETIFLIFLIHVNIFRIFLYSNFFFNGSEVTDFGCFRSDIPNY